jgi:nucleoside-diphosphate-sugar epimerase
MPRLLKGLLRGRIGARKSSSGDQRRWIYRFSSCRRVAGRDLRVRVVDNLSTGRLQNLNPRADLLEADICELDSIRPAVAGVDTVFHSAALARVNAVGTLNVLIAARDSDAA